MNRPNHRYPATMLIALLTLLLVLAACQQQPAAADPAEPTAQTDANENAPAEDAGMGDPGSLVIYSGRSESLVGPIIDQFAQATGIQVDVRYGSTAEMAGVLLEEGSNSPADIFYAQDPGGLGAIANAGLLTTLPETTLSRVPASFADPNGQWVGISGRARVVVYNTEAIADPASELPDDLEGFTAPEWRGRLGWAPSNGSFQAMVTAMRVIWGDEQTANWLSGIQANEPVVYEGNSPIVTAVGAGEIDAGLVNHYYLYRFLAEQGESFAARNYFLPGGGPGSLIMVSGAGILNSAPNAANAQRFVDFLLTLPAQQYFAAQTFEYPLVEGVNTPAGLPPLADLDALAVDVDLAQLSDLQGTQDMLIELGIID